MSDKDPNQWMNDQLRARRGITINRERPDGGIGDEIRDAFMEATGRQPASPKAKARTAQPVGPEPTIRPEVGLGTAMGTYRRWLYQHADLLDSQARLPGERGYDASSVGQADTFDLVTRRVAQWRDRRRDGARSAS